MILDQLFFKPRELGDPHPTSLFRVVLTAYFGQRYIPKVEMERTGNEAPARAAQRIIEDRLPSQSSSGASANGR
ncbi:MAG TPA: hypothetical protein VMV37_06695 [Gammaproteobacteria bacterium]|nr:hypothetical protein [Gammaproteobacteria bacterium]